MAGMPGILIGTSGYSYQEWVGHFYPAGTRQRDFLRLYANTFKAVELNFTYYRQPEAHGMDGMVNSTPDGFLFTVKAYQGLTHEIPADLHAGATQFKRGIQPLSESAKLGAVLMQFPYSFHYTVENRQYLQRLCSEFENMPLAIEFRNSEWLRESVYDAFRKLDIALVCVDEPNLPRLIKPSDRVTAHFSYLRFHGRNKENWWAGDSRSRYDYHYSDQELIEWIPRIRSMAEQASTLFVFFNNHQKGQAAANAQRLKELLGE